MKPFMALAAIALAGSAVVAQAPDWSRRAVATPAGSYVIGNPAAKAKVVEYLSYTCPSCANFVRESSPALKRDYLARGRASLEVRHALRDPLDLAAALLARCDGPAKFMGHSEAIFAKQTDWMARGSSYFQANGERLKALPREKALVEVARGSGLTAIVQARGLTPAKANACLISKPATEQLGAMATEAWGTRKIPGTPAFLINGTLAAGALDWNGLKPRLDAALK